MNQLVDRVGAFSNVRFELSRVGRDDRGFVAIWRMSAEHTGAVLLNEDEFFEASGLPVELSATTHVEFRDRCICTFRTAYQGPDPFEQMRRRPGPEAR